MREVEDNTRQFLVELLLQLFRQLLLGETCRPLIERLDRREQLDIGERRRIAAVVGAAVLRHHGEHLRMAQQDLPHLSRRLGAGLQRHGGRHRRADPEIALFQSRQKFAAEPARRKSAETEEDQPRDHSDLHVGERPAQHRRIGRTQRANDHRLGFLDLLRQQQRRQHRRHRERRQQRSGKGISICACHRAEDLTFDTLHREQRHEGGDGDGGSEEHRLVDLERADEDHAQPLRPAWSGRVAARCPGRIGTPVAFRQVPQDAQPIFRRRLEVAEDVFHHDDGGVDDDAEIDGAERQKIGVLALQHQDDDGEEQGEGDVRADDERAAQVAQEHPLDEEHEDAAEDQVVQHRVGGDVDQRTAIVIGDDLHPGRQAAVAVQLGDFLLHLRNNVIGVLGPSHDDDRGRDVVILVPAGNAEPRDIADRNLGDILDLDRKPARLGEDDIFDILDVIALGDVVGTAGIDQADAADVDGLLANRNLAPADIDIGIAERLHQLRHRDVVGLELLQVGVDVELLGGATPGIDLDDARDRHQAPRHHIILQRPQIGQTEIGRAHQFVAVDLADQARLLDLRHQVARQRDVLLNAVGGLGQGEVVVHPVLEGDADERQPVERGRADVDHARRRIEPDLHGDGIVFLHFLGGETGGLRGDLQNDRRRIRISLDIELCERGKAGGTEDRQTQHDDGASGQTERKDALDQGCTLLSRCDRMNEGSRDRRQWTRIALLRITHNPTGLQATVTSRAWRRPRPDHEPVVALANLLLRKIAPVVATCSPGFSPSRI